jgi:NAD(P)-dependent dehydrogenase (short-subunit alcohol dehydrogenase family)
MDLKLKGRRALVTGSTSGIGARIAEMLAEEGAAVAINGRDAVRGAAVVDRIRNAGGQAILAIGDLSTDAGAAAVTASLAEEFGDVDILVNNAGGSTKEMSGKDWFAAGTSDWVATFERNAGAAVRLIRALVPGMRERGWGRVIQIASAAGTMPPPGLPDYSASKAAMVNLTSSLAKTLAHTGVTVNAVSPGMIRTEALDKWLDGIAASQGWPDDRARAERFALDHYSPQTVSRLGTVDDIAQIVAYLASPLSDFINGTNFHVDGGQIPTIS